jgi:excisionase family DNA binding protein
MSELISIEEAAISSGMSVSWWRGAVAKKRVPYYRCGRRILFRRDEVERMLESNRVEPAVEDREGQPVGA